MEPKNLYDKQPFVELKKKKENTCHIRYAISNFQILIWTYSANQDTLVPIFTKINFHPKFKPLKNPLIPNLMQILPIKEK